MPQILLTEDGKKLTAETVAGVSGASSLNDTNVQAIQKFDFSTDPLLDGFLLGTRWVWDAVNKRLKIV